MKLRPQLIVFMLGAIVPVAVFAVFVATMLVERDRETFLRGAQERTLALMTAVDTELHGQISSLEALAVMPASSSGDRRRFRETARNFLASQGDWLNITLARPDGQQVVNLRVPEGRPLPNIRRLEGGFERLIATRQPVVGDLVIAPVSGAWNLSVRVPVIRRGELRYVLSAAIQSKAIDRIFAAQQLGREWGAVAIDRNQRFVSRNWEPEKFVGKMASQSLRDALARAPNGWFRGRTVEGIEVYSPYWRSEWSGWAVSMGVPAAAVDAAAARAGWILLLGVFGSILVALAGAHLVSRRIVDPIVSLAAAADSMARGTPVEVPETTHIDELRSLEAAVNTAVQAQQALQRADRAKDEFLAMLSHELRNPLAALGAAAHVLKVAEPTRDAAIKARGVVERQTKHMSRLIGDLLDISRVTHGKLALERQRLDLGDAVARLVNVWRASGRFERHPVHLETAPAWVDADRARVEQMTANLLDNALKFTPAGRAVRIGVGREGRDAVLRVADEGAGLAPGSTARLFELFVQPGHRGGGGLGIGLALVKRLAEMHGGSVIAESEGPDRGAVFTVRLPLAASGDAPAAEAAIAAAPSRSILIVEDNDDARQMLEVALTLSGHKVRAAHDGASGLALAAAAPPEVALIDVGLPDMDGYEVARRLRATPAGRRIGLIALTGYGQPEDRRRALEAGFDAHLTKPVAADRLKQAIAELR
jgi:signal transduction histidine kinase